MPDPVPGIGGPPRSLLKVGFPSFVLSIGCFDLRSVCGFRFKRVESWIGFYEVLDFICE